MTDPCKKCEDLKREVVEALGHLSVAVVQTIPSDDQIIARHTETAQMLLQSALRRHNAAGGC